jgi:DNA-binding NarL/FixJ family response regulator
MTEKIRIVVIDDHPLFREGVVNTLRADARFDVIAEGTTALDALQMASEHLPDLLLLDINIPGGGLNILPRMTADCPVTKVIMLTASEEEDAVLSALKAGARGYILKGVAARELIRTLHAVYDGEAYVTPTLAASLLSEMTGDATATHPANPLDQLTAREREILQLVATGQSNKEIGFELHLSEKTVKHYMTNILQKLQVRNRVEAALLAQRDTNR